MAKSHFIKNCLYSVGISLQRRPRRWTVNPDLTSFRCECRCLLREMTPETNLTLFFHSANTINDEETLLMTSHFSIFFFLLMFNLDEPLLVLIKKKIAKQFENCFQHETDEKINKKQSKPDKPNMMQIWFFLKFGVYFSFFFILLFKNKQTYSLKISLFIGLCRSHCSNVQNKQE